MNSPDTDAPDPWSLRASDADRDGYLELLRDAFADGRLDPIEHEERVEAVLSSRTYRDLYSVLAELPVDPQRVPGPPVAASAEAQSGHSTAHLVPIPVAEAGHSMIPIGASSDDSVMALLGSGERSGQWIVPVVQQATSILGDVNLDLTSAVLTGPVTEIRCAAVLGSVTIVIPDSLRVEVAGTQVLGEFNQRDRRKRGDRQRVPAPDAPIIRIGGVAFLGEVKVQIVKPKTGTAAISIQTQSLSPSPEPPALDPRATDSADAVGPDPVTPESVSTDRPTDQVDPPLGDRNHDATSEAGTGMSKEQGFNRPSQLE